MEASSCTLFINQTEYDITAFTDIFAVMPSTKKIHIGKTKVLNQNYQLAHSIRKSLLEFKNQCLTPKQCLVTIVTHIPAQFCHRIHLSSSI